MKNENDVFQEILKSAQADWQQGNLDEALKKCSRLDLVYQDHPDVLHLKGILCWQQRQLDRALFYLQAASEKRPGHWPDLHLSLAQVLRECGKLNAAKIWFERARNEAPFQSDIHYALGMLYAEMGNLQDASLSLSRASELKPSDWRYQTTRLFYLTATPGLSHHERLNFFKAVAATHLDLQAPVRPQFAQSPDPERKLRIAYISADFRQHVAAHSLRALFSLADRKQFEIIAYNMVVNPDQWTHWFKEHADTWRDCQTLSDQQLLELLHQDCPDIVIDCSGYTFGNRLEVFACRPAPIQISAFGFIYTTGMRAIDYQFTDLAAVPEDCCDWYSESLIYLSSQMLWTPPQEEVPTSLSPPYLDNTVGLTFGSGNASYKLNSDVIALWGRLLHAVPHSRLLLKHKRFELDELQQHFKQLFIQQGINPDRIQFRGASSNLEQLAFYNELDIALDPFPYSGGMTTCETLYMGVPVISMDGDVTRTSIPILHAVGAQELIAEDAEHYLACAITLANDPQRLLTYRQELRSKLLSSPITNATLFVSEIEAAYREVWRIWCDEVISD